MADKKGVIMFYDILNQLEDFNDKDFREIIEAVINYDKDGTLPQFTGEKKIAFKFIKVDIDKNNEEYRKKCEQNKANISKRWNTKDTTEYDRIQTNIDIDIDKDIDLDKKNNNNAQSKQVASEPALYKLQLNDNSYFEITQSFYDELKPLYPAVDLDNEFRKMVAWLIGNPKNRKTKSGIKRFITSWLNRQQDKGGNTYQKPAEKPQLMQHEYTSEELNNLFDDIDNIKLV